MNREEAIKIFSGIASLAKINTEPTMSVCNVKNEVFTEILQALLAHQPDPITCLVPCGCGGEVVRYGRNLLNRFTTGCSECGTLSWSEFSQEDADKNWNNSRGYRDL